VTALLAPNVLDVEPPDALAPESFAERLYLALAPVARWDDENAWSLLILVNAIGAMFQTVDDVVRDTPDGPGFSILLDLNRCPSEALDWLGQFVGVRLPAGATDAEKRAAIAAESGFRRGTRAALEAAVKATLTGAQTVIVRERSGDSTAEPIDYAYRLKIRTYPAETPDAAATLAAALSQKPGGIVLDYATVAPATYGSVAVDYATYAVVAATFADYFALLASES